MSWFEPSRIPAWLAPVCEERSGSHSVSLCEPSASHFAMCGALPSRIARRSTGNASPSISRKTIPGTSVRVAPPWRFAIRWTTRSVYVSSSFVEKITSSTTLTAATTSAASSAQPKLSTSNESRMSLPILSATAFGDQHEDETERKHERQPQRCEERRDDRVDGRDDRGHREGAAGVHDVDAGQEPSRSPQGDSGEDPRDQQPRGSEARPLGLPADGLAVSGHSRALFFAAFFSARCSFCSATFALASM